MFDWRFRFVLLLSLLLWTRLEAELVVNVNPSASSRESSSSFYRQTISGNSSTETVLIQYSLPDGTLVSQLTDFRMNSQIVRILIPGEEELNQPVYQALCFISNYQGDIIPPEAVMKLRQKHPNAVRVAEEDHGEIVQDSPLSLLPISIRLATVSSHLSSFCKDAKDSTLSSHHELFTILEKSGGLKPEEISKFSHKNYEHLSRCFSLKESQFEDQSCICSLQICFNWFPCALKYCNNKEGEGEHRCGIKTCRKCMTYRYSVPSKLHCSWDEI